MCWSTCQDIECHFFEIECSTIESFWFCLLWLKSKLFKLSVCWVVSSWKWTWPNFCGVLLDVHALFCHAKCKLQGLLPVLLLLNRTRHYSLAKKELVSKLGGALCFTALYFSLTEKCSTPLIIQNFFYLVEQLATTLQLYNESQGLI